MSILPTTSFWGLIPNLAQVYRHGWNCVALVQVSIYDPQLLLLGTSAMNPVEFYLSRNASLDELDLTPAETAPVNKYIDKLPDGNALRFFGPLNVEMFANYRLMDGRLQIVSPFGAASVDARGVTDGSQVALTSLCPEGLASWRVQARSYWSDGRGERSLENSMRAKDLGGGRFEPLHVASHARLSGIGAVGWAIVFLPEAHSSIKKNRQGGADILTPSGLAFELPKGKAADLVLAGKTQWAIPGEHGVFVLAEPPWLK